MATILIVDDHALNREFLNTLLSYQHHRLLEATDGREALKVLEQHPVDLVITDILMPHLDGYELAQTIRAHPIWNSLPIIFYTATYRAEEANLLGKACRVEAVLAKPAEPADILAQVGRLLKVSLPDKEINKEAPVYGFKEKYLGDFNKNLSFTLQALTAANSLLNPSLDTGASPVSPLPTENLKATWLAELVLRLVVERDISRMLQLFNKNAGRMLGAHLSITGIAGEQPNTFDPCLMHNKDGGEWIESPRSPLPQDLWHHIVSRHQAIRLETVSLSFSTPAVAKELPNRAFLGVPVASATQNYGILGFMGKTDGSLFTVEDERIAMTMAAALGTLYENVQLYETIQHHAVKLQLEITERKKTEHALRQSEAQFRQFAEHVQDIFWISSPDLQQILYVNSALTKVWGRSAVEFYQNPAAWLTAVYPEDKPLLQEALSQLIAEQKSMDIEYRISRPEGDTRWMRTRGFSIKDAFGRVSRQAGITSDITEQKEAEALARRHRAELEQITRVNSMGEMASTLAHEINQPLTAVSGYIGGCIRRLEGGNSPTEDIVGKMRKAAQNVELMGEIIHRMKNFVRHGELHYENISPNDLVEETIALIYQEIYQTRVTFQLELAQALPGVSVDKVQVEQVLLNLIRNSIEAMLGNAKSIAPIVLKTLQLNAHTIAIRVSDAGPGIPEEIQEKLFKPYFTTKSKGMGMGLAICRTIVEAHGGQISVDSQPGQGACFQFTLPVKPEEKAHA